MIFSQKKYILCIYLLEREIIMAEVLKIQKWGNSQGIRLPKKILIGLIATNKLLLICKCLHKVLVFVDAILNTQKKLKVGGE